MAHQEKIFKEGATFMNQMDPHAGEKFMDPLTWDTTTSIPPYTTKVPTMPNQMHMLNPIPMQQVIVTHPPTTTYSGYEPQKIAFFEQRTTLPAEPENNLACELEDIKEEMSHLFNEIINLKLNSSRNQGHHPRQLATQNGCSQNQSTNFGSYENNTVLNHHPQVMEENVLQFNAMMFESYDKSSREQSDENDQEELLFPFNEEEYPKHFGIHGYVSGNPSTYSLKRKEEPPIDDVSLQLNPTPPDLPVCNTPALYEAPTEVAPTLQKELHVKEEVLKGFMDILIVNVKYLGEGQNQNILLLPSYYHLHQKMHSELECASCQDAVSHVLAQMDQPTTIARNNRTNTNCDVTMNTDMARNYKDVEIYGAAQLLKDVENCGDAQLLKVAKVFESISSHEEDSNASYSDANSMTENQETSSHEHDMSVEEMDKVLNMVSILIEERSIHRYSMPMSNHAVTNSCRVHPLELHSEVSCPEFLLAWEIAMEGKYDLEDASLKLEGENTLINDNNEPCNLKDTLMVEFVIPKEPKSDNSWFGTNDGDNKECKHNYPPFGSCFDSYIPLPMQMFPYAHGGVYHEIRPPEEQIALCKCTPMVGNLLNQVISFHYPSQVNNLQFEYDAKGKRTCFWINHDHEELPQLLILCDLCPEFELTLPKFYFSEYKDKSAFLRTIWGGLLLINIMRNLLITNLCSHCPR